MIEYSLYRHVLAVLQAMTQLTNALLGSCDSHESLSERSFHNRNRGWFWPMMYRIINFLAWRESNHCEKAYIKRVRWCEAYLKFSKSRDYLEGYHYSEGVHGQ